MKKGKKDKGVNLIEEMKLQNSALEKIKADVNKNASNKSDKMEDNPESHDDE